MKIQELFTNMINVTEAFNAQFDTISWETFNDSLIAKAMLGDDHFKLYIEPAEFTFDDITKVWVNVAFARIVNGVISQDLINTGISQSKQIGAIVNSLTAKLKEFADTKPIDAIVFIVEKGQEKRIPLYKKIMLSKVYGIRPWQYRMSIEWFGGTALIATEKMLAPKEYAALEKEIKSRRKRLI